MERVLRPERGAEPARFFQRIFAALIDGIFLALVFFFAVIPTLGWFAPKTLFVQSLITIAYYSILNSRRGGGATLGKRAMGIRVINRQGDYISYPRAILRSAVDVLPTTLGVYIPMMLPGTTWPVAEIGAATSSAFGLANIYLYIFNYETRQVLHDLVVGSFVVQAETSENPFEARTHAGHVAVALLLIAVTGFIGTRLKLFKEAVDGPALCAEPITAKARLLPFVSLAYVNRTPMTLTKISDPDHTTIMAYVKERVSYKQAQQVARASIAACPALHDERLLRIVLIPQQRGYSLRPRIGVFSASVAQWRDNLTYVARITPKEGPCTKAIVGAIQTLPFARRVHVTEGILSMPKGHYTEIAVAGPVGNSTPSAMARAIADKTLKACPAMADEEAVDVIVSPMPPTRMTQSFNASAKEWRTRLAEKRAENAR